MMSTTTRSERPRRLRNAAPLLLSGLALFAATTGIATALPGTSTVNSGDIVNNSVKSKDLKDGKAVQGVDVIDASIGEADLAPNSVDSEELGDGIHAHSATTVVPGGVARNGNYNIGTRTVSCGAGEELISGSANWFGEAPSDELFVSEVELNHGSESVTASGGNDAGANRTLVAVAHCL